jgi:hypothetical protein
LPSGLSSISSTWTVSPVHGIGGLLSREDKAIRLGVQEASLPLCPGSFVSLCARLCLGLCVQRTERGQRGLRLSPSICAQSPLHALHLLPAAQPPSRCSKRPRPLARSLALRERGCGHQLPPVPSLPPPSADADRAIRAGGQEPCKGLGTDAPPQAQAPWCLFPRSSHRPPERPLCPPEALCSAAPAEEDSRNKCQGDLIALPAHGRPVLTRRCPHPAPASWSPGNLLTCRCGQSLRHPPRGLSGRISRERLTVSTHTEQLRDPPCMFVE